MASPSHGTRPYGGSRDLKKKKLVEQDTVGQDIIEQDMIDEILSLTTARFSLVMLMLDISRKTIKRNYVNKEQMCGH